MNHFDERGQAIMVDVGGKAPTARIAVAEGRIRMNRAAFEAIRGGTSSKGDVLGVARVAGIMAVKRTPDLIPLCHPLMTERAGVDFVLDEALPGVVARCTVGLTGRTGVEMEAMTGASVALLTIYDMCKAVDRAMVIEGVRLLHKDGGRSGAYRAEDA